MLVVSVLSVLLVAGCVPETYKFTREMCKAGRGRGEIMGGTDITAGKSGELVIADAGNYRFQVLDAKDGRVKRVAGEYGTEQFQLKSMAGIGFNALTGEVAVCDFRADKVILFEADGNPKLRIQKEVRGPTDVTFDRSGHLFVVMRNGGPVFKYNYLGNLVDRIGGTGKSALVSPSSIHFNKDHLFITDTGSRRVLKMDMKGNVVLEITQKGEYEQLRGPSSVYIDNNDGSIFVTDLGDVPVVKFTAEGQFVSKIGSLGEGEGRFVYPRSCMVTDVGELIVLDNSRNTLLFFQSKQ